MFYFPTLANTIFQLRVSSMTSSCWNLLEGRQQRNWIWWLPDSFATCFKTCFNNMLLYFMVIVKTTDKSKYNLIPGNKEIFWTHHPSRRLLRSDGCPRCQPPSQLGVWHPDLPPENHAGSRMAFTLISILIVIEMLPLVWLGIIMKALALWSSVNDTSYKGIEA